MKKQILLFSILALSSIGQAQTDSCTIQVPTEIGINEEGTNNHLTFTASCEMQTFEVSIYNRWGREVYASMDINESWDCTKAEADHYMWVVKAVTISGEAVDKKGNFKIIKERTVIEE